MLPVPTVPLPLKAVSVALPACLEFHAAAEEMYASSSGAPCQTPVVTVPSVITFDEPGQVASAGLLSEIVIVFPAAESVRFEPAASATASVRPLRLFTT